MDNRHWLDAEELRTWQSHLLANRLLSERVEHHVQHGRADSFRPEEV